MDRKAEFKELKDTLDIHGLSQAWAAKQCGVSSAYMGMVLSGKSTPGPDLKKEMISLKDRLRSAGLRAV